MKKRLHHIRFELLFITLLMVLFNKIFFFNGNAYSQWIWPANMTLLGLTSVGVFHENRTWVRNLKFLFFIPVIMVPFLSNGIFSDDRWSFAALLLYFIYYSLIFSEIFRQMFNRTAIRSNAIYAALSGFLLLILLAAFSFMLMDLSDHKAFGNIEGHSIPERYHQFIYFSTITLSTIGYGDILALSDQSRLLSGFWGVMSQFYMIAVVGVLISRYSNQQTP